MTTDYTAIQQSFVDAYTNIGTIAEADVQTAEEFIFGLATYLSWPNGNVVYNALIPDTHIPITGIGGMTLVHVESPTTLYTTGGGVVAASLQLYVDVDVGRLAPIRLKFFVDVSNDVVEIELRRSNIEGDTLRERHECDWTLSSREAVYEKIGVWLMTYAKEMLVRNWWKASIVDNQTAQTALYNLGVIA
jgi:hypothetical protein